MGELARFLRDLREHPQVGDHFFDPHLLNYVAAVLEKRGFEEARIALWDSHSKVHQEKQAVILLDIVTKMENVAAFNNNRALAGHLIRNLSKAQEHRIKKRR